MGLDLPSVRISFLWLGLDSSHVRDTFHLPLQAHLPQNRLGEVPGKVCVGVGGRVGDVDPDVTVVTGKGGGRVERTGESAGQ